MQEASGPNKFLIGGSTHQHIEFTWIGDRYLDDPTFAIRIVVDQSRVIATGLGDITVKLEDRAAHRHKQIRGGLDRFNGAKNGILGKGLAYGVYFNINQLTQFALGKISDTHHSDLMAVWRLVAGDMNPLVLGGVFEMIRKMHNRLIERVT